MLPFFIAMFLSWTRIFLSTTGNIYILELEFAIVDNELSVADRDIAIGELTIPLPDSKIRPVKPRCRGHG
jgi:hypothetical protein